MVSLFVIFPDELSQSRLYADCAELRRAVKLHCGFAEAVIIGTNQRATTTVIPGQGVYMKI